MSALSPPLIMLGLMLLSPFQGSAQERRTEALVEVNSVAGRMVVALFNDTPLHRDRFLALVQAHCHDSVPVARVTPGFIILSGDPAGTGPCADTAVHGPLPTEVNATHVHLRGALVAAALEGDTGRTHGTRFFLVDGQAWTVDDLRYLEEMRRADDARSPRYTPEQLAAYVDQGGAPRLDGRYTVFGRVVEGLEVVSRLAMLPADEHDRPLTAARLWMRILP